MWYFFTVPGDPHGKARPRLNKYRGTIHDPAENQKREQHIYRCFVEACGVQRFPEDEQLYIRVTAYYPIPKSTTKKKRVEMANHFIRPTVKPDVDNVAKLVMDALQDHRNEPTKRLYADDKQVVRLVVEKYYSDDPRTEVLVGDNDRSV